MNRILLGLNVFLVLMLVVVFGYQTYLNANPSSFSVSDNVDFKGADLELRTRMLNASSCDIFLSRDQLLDLSTQYPSIFDISFSSDFEPSSKICTFAFENGLKLRFSYQDSLASTDWIAEEFESARYIILQAKFGTAVDLDYTCAGNYIHPIQNLPKLTVAFSSSKLDCYDILDAQRSLGFVLAKNVVEQSESTFLSKSLPLIFVLEKLKSPALTDYRSFIKSRQ